MWNNDSRPVPSSLRERDDVVKDLIEKCLQLYMNLDEVMAGLSESFNIEPHLTFTVWKQLEKDNPRFFHDYYVRLKLIQQITQFNRLLQQQQQYELMLYGKLTSPSTRPSPDIAGGICQQQHSNAATVQQGGDVFGSLHGEHSASNATAMAATMGRPVQPHSLHSNNQREFPTYASSSEQSMPSSCCLPLDSLGEYKQGAASSVDIQNQGRLSLLNNPASSTSPDHGAFETEANQLNSLDFLLDTPEHHGAGGLPDAPSESHPESQTPGETN